MGENSSQSRATLDYLPVNGVNLSLLTRKNSDKSVTNQVENLREDELTIDRKTADEKAARMLEKFANQHFNSVRDVQRMRLQLLLWVIRHKIRSSVKRIFDLILLIPAFFIAIPIFIVTAILIKLDSPGPVIFTQERVGKWGKPFKLYKFRSMRVDAEEVKDDLLESNDADEIIFKIKDDPRKTRVGRFIRKFSLDEIPQLFNVLKGDMSLVGPRPPVPYEVAQYEYNDRRRLDVLPGITGLQQVSGRSDLPFKKWVEYDIQYIEESSLLKDIEIVLKTIPAVILGRGAY